MTINIDLPHPSELICYPGSIKILPDKIGGTNKNVFIMGRFNKLKMPDVYDSIMSSLEDKDHKVTIFDKINYEPTIQDIDEAAEICRDKQCDVIVAIGGGSSIDAAKAVSILMNNPGSVREYQMDEKPISEREIKLIAVPTTAGTGAESNWVSVITNTEENIKKSIKHACLVPDVALLDPELMVSLSPEFTALTGIDAFSHALENIVSTNANHYTRALDIKAIELIGENIVRAYRDGTDFEARYNMAIASCMAGIAIHTGVGSAHMLSQPLGMVLGMRHSETIAAVLAATVESNLEYAKDTYCQVASVLIPQTSGISGDEAAASTVTFIRDMLEKLEIGIKLSDRGLTESQYQDVLENVKMSTAGIKTNPRPIDDDVLIEIMNKSM